MGTTVLGNIGSFEDLECYKAARELRIAVALWAKSLPSEEKFRLADQIVRAARSITANIAEGFGRQHPQENLQFCRQARGSLMETLEHLNTALDEQLLSSAQYDTMHEQWNRARAILLGYIKYLQTLSAKDRKFTERD